MMEGFLLFIQKYWKLTLLVVASVAGYIWFNQKGPIDDLIEEKTEYTPEPIPDAPKDIDWAGKLKKDLEKIEEKRAKLKEDKYLKMVNKKYGKRRKR